MAGGWGGDYSAPGSGNDPGRRGLGDAILIAVFVAGLVGIVLGLVFLVG